MLCRIIRSSRLFLGRIAFQACLDLDARCLTCHRLGSRVVLNRRLRGFCRILPRGSTTAAAPLLARSVSSALNSSRLLHPCTVAAAVAVADAAVLVGAAVVGTEPVAIDARTASCISICSGGEARLPGRIIET